MPRKVDQKRIDKIREVLRKNPDGLWIRELARKSGVDKSAVSRYIAKSMKNEVEEINISGLVKIVKLKRQ